MLGASPRRTVRAEGLEPRLLFASAPLFALGDVNGDGKADLVSFAKNAAAVAAGNGDGTFAAATSSAGLGADFGPAPALADVNGDGRADLVGFGGGVARAAPGTTDGLFGP